MYTIYDTSVMHFICISNNLYEFTTGIITWLKVSQMMQILHFAYNEIIMHTKYDNNSKLIILRYSFYLNNVHKISFHHNVLYCNFVTLV